VTNLDNVTLDKWVKSKKSEEDQRVLVPIKEAAKLMSEKFNKEIREHNISYLVQYGRVKKYKIGNRVFVDINEVEEYYKKLFYERREKWEKELGMKLDWELAFDMLTEKERTKHVHGIHPYKGKYIPQLVEYFLERYFKPGDIVIDPFMGSGTTLVQALEMGIHSIGIEISPFNCLIAEVKLQKYDLDKLEHTLLKLLDETRKHIEERPNREFDEEVDRLIAKYNQQYFDLDYKRKLHMGEINEKEYAEKVMKKFQEEYSRLKEKYKEKIRKDGIFADKKFLYTWYSPEIREELMFYLNLIKEIQDDTIKKVAMIILSRTARSVRATTHFDLATLKKPVFDPYYCFKHKKICRPVTTIWKHLKLYTYDTLERIKTFSKLRKDAFYAVINADSRTVDIDEKLEVQNPDFYKLFRHKRAQGIITSPPYLGQINYHEQHAYAYELFDLPRLDELEIGPKYKGTSKKAQREYIDGIVKVLTNMKRFLSKDANIFIVVNDNRGLYPKIIEESGLELIKEFKRPVLNRTERDRRPYYESIFHLKIEE